MKAATAVEIDKGSILLDGFLSLSYTIEYLIRLWFQDETSLYVGKNIKGKRVVECNGILWYYISLIGSTATLGSSAKYLELKPSPSATFR